MHGSWILGCYWERIGEYIWELDRNHMRTWWEHVGNKGKKPKNPSPPHPPKLNCSLVHAEPSHWLYENFSFQNCLSLIQFLYKGVTISIWIAILPLLLCFAIIRWGASEVQFFSLHGGSPNRRFYFEVPSLWPNYLSMKEGSLFCFVVMRSSWDASYRFLGVSGWHWLGSMTFGLVVQSSWILNDFLTENKIKS
jgi:hypothetical protein